MYNKSGVVDVLQNTETSYGLFTKGIHWVLAAMIIGVTAVGFYMPSLPPSDDKWHLYGLHKATGVVILALVFLRIAVRLTNIQPKLPATTPTWIVKSANANIFLLYCLMLAQPLTGFLGSLMSGHDISVYGLFTIKAFGEYKAISTLLWQMHGIIPYALVALILVHIFGGLYHHFILRDNVLRRMFNG
jgi:cytochrome b561